MQNSIVFMCNERDEKLKEGSVMVRKMLQDSLIFSKKKTVNICFIFI